MEKRMITRKNRKPFLLYPEDPLKVNWDLFITLVLVITCLATPYNIAYGEMPSPIGVIIFSYTIDLMFLIDIIIIFHSAYYDEEFVIVENRK